MGRPLPDKREKLGSGHLCTLSANSIAFPIAHLFPRNQKPTESDLEDDDDDSDDDDDPATWFEDDQDDGRKGQDIVEPDIDDLHDIIRIDESRLHYSSFYEPRDGDD
jgi:hypothetical protein